MGLVFSLHTINSIFSIFPSRLAMNQSNAVLPNQRFHKLHPLLLGLRFLVSLIWFLVQKVIWISFGELFMLYIIRGTNMFFIWILSRRQRRGWSSPHEWKKEPIFAKVGNVYMITKANMVTYRGPTMVANTLHACAILLKRSKDWDWFINLSASDYPLVTQDG
jgi:hypothetical protein